MSAAPAPELSDREREIVARFEAAPVIDEAWDAQRGHFERHCETCICGRRAPVQGERRHARGDKPDGTVAWEEHLEAYVPYAARYGTSQSAERLAERCGFGYWEMTDLLGHEPTTWQVATR